MIKPQNGLSAFDQGQKAAKEQVDSLILNPFLTGSREHNNFEVGRRFGTKQLAASERSRERPHVVSAGEES